MDLEDATAWKLRVEVKNRAIPMATWQEPVSNHLIFAISIATGAIPSGVRLNTGVLSIAKVDQ